METKITEITEFDPKYTKKIYDFVMEIKAGELGWRSEATDLFEIDKNYIKDGGNLWVALDDDRIIGTIALKNMGAGQGYLKRMYVDKKYRGTGLAQKLFEILQKFAKSKNLKEIYLATTTGPTVRAIGFYKKIGFKRVKTLPWHFTHYGEDYIMKKRIDF